MVKEIKKNGKMYFQCGECKMFFSEEKWAVKCGEFCRENKACSVEITKHAVSFDGGIVNVRKIY